jgi:hypothetical protein
MKQLLKSVMYTQVLKYGTVQTHHVRLVFAWLPIKAAAYNRGAGSRVTEGRAK